MNTLRHLYALILLARAWLRDETEWGRREDPRPVKCDHCGWQGPRAWANHDYLSWGLGDEINTQPMDFCPECRFEI